jgi:hypothetical protein
MVMRDGEARMGVTERGGERGENGGKSECSGKYPKIFVFTPFLALYCVRELAFDRAVFTIFENTRKISDFASKFGYVFIISEFSLKSSNA